MKADVSRREAFFGAIALIAVFALVAPTAVQAATQKVKVQGTVKIADTSGDVLDSKDIGDLGELGAPGSDGALAVRTYGGGGGFLGTGDCTADATTSRPNTTTVEAGDHIITAIIVTGTDAKVTVDAPDLDALIGPFPVANFRANMESPNVFVGLGNGLSVFPSELVFTCTGEDGGDGVGDYVILGQ